MIHTEYIKGNDILIVMCEEHDLNIEIEGSSLLLVKDIDWNRDLSPWKADRVFRKGEDFGGQADETLKIILDAMKEIPYRKAMIAGYSLAGLFALYACTKTDAFAGCVSASGSLWFPGFDVYLKQNKVKCESVYLSLGDKEKNTHNPVMEKIEEKTYEAYEVIGQYTHVKMEMNPGNHFNEPEKRLRKGIDHILADL